MVSSIADHPFRCCTDGHSLCCRAIELLYETRSKRQVWYHIIFDLQQDGRYFGIEAHADVRTDHESIVNDLLEKRLLMLTAARIVQGRYSAPFHTLLPNVMYNQTFAAVVAKGDCSERKPFD